jgi:small subunit ribosomal protein S15
MESSNTETTPRGSNSKITEEVVVGSLKLSDVEKSEVITRFARTSQDCGSPEVQIALLTQRLELLAKHFSSNPKDHHSRRGMLNLISQRKQLLSYLRGSDVARYRTTIQALGLRK